MRLFILGATGRTGAELVNQALARGHAVTALFRDVVRDAREMERVVVASGMDWTMVRPPQLMDGGARSANASRRGTCLRGFSISRADLAHFMLQEVENPRHPCAIVGVCR